MPSPHPLLPDSFGTFVSAGESVANFTGGLLVVQGTDAGLLPVRWDEIPTYGTLTELPAKDDAEAWERIEKTLYCGHGVFEHIVADLKNLDAARRRVTYEAEVARARGFGAAASLPETLTPALPGTGSGAPSDNPPTAPTGPVSTWVDVARAIGVDDSTLRAVRRRTGDKTRPIFGSAEEARAWYRALVGEPGLTPPPRAPRHRSRKGVAASGPVDWSKEEV